MISINQITTFAPTVIKAKSKVTMHEIMVFLYVAFVHAADTVLSADIHVQTTQWLGI